MILRICLFLLSSIVFLASSQGATVLSCTSQQFPQIHLTADISNEDEFWSGKYLLKINLTNPEENANTRIADIFTSKMESGTITLSESYIHGIKLYHKDSWLAEVQIFEFEKPILLNCR